MTTRSKPPDDAFPVDGPSRVSRRVGWLGRQYQRFLARDRGSAALIVAALALGIGLVGTIFACLDGYLFRGLPFPGGDRFYHVGLVDRAGPDPRLAMNFRQYYHLREAAPLAVSTMISFEEATASLSVDGGLPMRCVAYRLSGDLPQFLGVQPLLGRGFTPAEQMPGGDRAVQISHRLWQEQFGGDPGVLGRVVEVDGVDRTIVGVWGPDFRFIRDNDILVSQQHSPHEGGKPDTIVAVRLHPGVAVGEAEAALGAGARRLAKMYPEDGAGWQAVSLRPLHQAMLGPTTVRRLWILQAFAALVLVIGCCNAASLLAARFAARRGEMAVRTALGATRGRLMTQIAAECAVFAIAGALGGVALAHVGVQLLWSHVAPFVPFWVEAFVVSPATLGAVCAATVLAALLASLGPALHGSRVHPAEVLKENQRTATGSFLRRFSASMVIVQVAVAFALLTGAGMLVRAVRSVEDIRLPFEPSEVLTARVTLRGAAGEPAAARRFVEGLERELEERSPDLGPVAFTSREGLKSVPRVALTAVDTGASAVSLAGLEVAEEVVSPEYFAVLGVAPLQGREFTRFDTTEGMPVAVVNQSLARRLWPDTPAVGRRFRAGSEPRWLTVVGVVPDLRQQGYLNFKHDSAGYYRPSTQVDEPASSVIVRPRTVVADWENRIRRAIFRIDADQAPKDVGTMRNSLGGDMALPRTLAFLFVLFGAAATVVAGIGIYGLAAFAVAVRTREFGIRLVFGALARDIAALATRQGLAQVIPGLGAGLAIAYLVAELLEGAELLSGIPPRDPAVYAIVAFIILIVTAAAISRPVIHAMRLQPWEAIHQP